MTFGEQRVASGAALAAGAFFAVLWRPWEGGARWWFFAIGLVLALGLYGTSRLGHRAFTAFGAFVLGVFGPWDIWYLFGAFYVGFAFWLARRVFKDQQRQGRI